ncbi:MAG: lytic transglycosylase [Vicinamibacterales bacterium]
MHDSTRAHGPAGRCRVPWRAATALLLVFALPAPGAAGNAVAAHAAETLQPDDVSPLFLGMYRKVMVIEDQIRQHAERYGVDYDLARAICLYESGGNAGLASRPGARGYFQVMPRTFRSLKVQTNIEAGVKYLGLMVKRFAREDRAVAAYNGGPTRVDRNRGLPLETLQYVLGVGQYRTVLKRHDASIRQQAAGIDLTTVRAGEDWAAVAARLGVREWEVRLHNPFLAQRRLLAGQLVAYPKAPRTDLFRAVDGAAEYRMRYGDNYLKLAFTLGVAPDAMRAANGLWHLQAVPTGTVLRIPLADDRTALVHAALGLAPEAAMTTVALATVPPELTTPEPAPPAAPTATHRVARGDTLGALARRYGTTVSALRAANGLGRRSTIRIGQPLRLPGTGDGPPATVRHRVARGDTLGALARRYGTSVSAIQRANAMARRTTIRPGQVLRIPR